MTRQLLLLRIGALESRLADCDLDVQLARLRDEPTLDLICERDRVDQELRALREQVGRAA